jgi:membrane-bound lytic murein transglycosylase D
VKDPKAEKEKDIYIPEEKEAPAALPVYHIVAAQETLYAISKKYQVTVAQIQSWNNITDTNIKIGQQLIVGYK